MDLKKSLSIKPIYWNYNIQQSYQPLIVKINQTTSYLSLKWGESYSLSELPLDTIIVHWGQA